MLMTIYWSGVIMYAGAALCVGYKLSKDSEIRELMKEMKAADFHPSLWQHLKAPVLAFVPIAHWLFAGAYILCIANEKFWKKTRDKVIVKAREEFLCKQK